MNLEYPDTVAGDLPVLGWLQIDLDDDCAVILPLLARCGVLAGHPAGLVEHVRCHSACICAYKYLKRTEIHLNKILF